MVGIFFTSPPISALFRQQPVIQLHDGVSVTRKQSPP